MRPESLFGLPRALTGTQVRELREDILFYGSGTGHDLSVRAGRAAYEEWLVKLITPTNREMTVRKNIASVEATSRAPTTAPSDQMFLRLEARRWAPSLEALLVLPLFLEATGDEPLVFEADAIATLSAAAADTYRELSMSRLDRVTELLSGSGGQLLVVPTAQLMLILLNNSTSPERSLPKYPRDNGVPEVAAAFRIGIERIGSAAHTGLEAPSSPGEWELGGYSLSEINRRLLPPGLTDTPLTLAFLDNEIPGFHLHPSRVDDAQHLLGWELQRRVSGNSAGVGTVEDILDVGIETYRASVRPALSDVGVAFGTPSLWGRMRSGILRGAHDARGSDASIPT